MITHENYMKFVWIKEKWENCQPKHHRTCSSIRLTGTISWFMVNHCLLNSTRSPSPTKQAKFNLNKNLLRYSERKKTNKDFVQNPNKFYCPVEFEGVLQVGFYGNFKDRKITLYPPWATFMEIFCTIKFYQQNQFSTSLHYLNWGVRWQGDSLFTQNHTLYFARTQDLSCSEISKNTKATENPSAYRIMLSSSRSKEVFESPWRADLANCQWQCQN